MFGLQMALKFSIWSFKFHFFHIRSHFFGHFMFCFISFLLLFCVSIHECLEKREEIFKKTQKIESSLMVKLWSLITMILVFLDSSFKKNLNRDGFYLQ